MDTVSNAWRVFLPLGLIASVVQVFIEPDRPVSSYAFVAIALASAGVMAWGAFRQSRRGPWLMMLAGVAAMVAGDILWVYYEFTGTDPFPSLADALYLPGYPLIAVGLLWMLGASREGGARDSLIDATIVATGSGVLSWMFLIAPYLQDAELTIAERGVSAAYPLMGVLLVAMVARVGFARGTAGLSSLLLGAGLVALLIADTYLGFIELTSGYEHNKLAEFLWLAMYVLFGGAAMAPETAEEQRERVAGVSVATIARWRMPLLTVASLMAPGVLALQAFRGRNVDLFVIAFGSAVLFMLVLVRLVGLLNKVEEQATEVERLATMDPLTSLPNRRHWHAESERLLAEATRTGEPLAVAMIDLDYFKQYNDAHGHHAGDDLLRDCTSAWKVALRPSDVLARLGGDEFALALPNCTLDRAEDVLARLRSRVPPDQSISCGVALWDGDETADRLMIRADMALYVAKEQGRRRTVRAEPAEDGLTTASG